MRRSKRRRRRLIAATVVFLLLVMSATTFFMMRSTMRQQAFVDARSIGLAAHKEGEYAVALRHLSYYLSDHKDDVQALVAFAEARSRVATPDDRHITEPIALYNIVLEMEPENERALNNILLLYERTGNRVEWMAAAKELLQLDPMHSDAIRLKALGYSAQRRFDEAEHYISRLSMLDPDEISWRLLHVQILQHANRPTEEIIELCQQWIEAYDGDGRYDMLKANVLATAGDRPAAREAALQAVKKGASDSDILQQLLSLLDVLQMPQEARTLLATTRQQNPEASWPYEAAVRRHWQQGNIDTALLKIDKIEQQHERLSTALLRWKSLLLILNGRFSDADTVLEELATHANEHAAERDSIRAWVAAARGRINLDDGALADSLNAYSSALALDPNDPMIHFLMGEAYARVHEHELAIQSLEHALRSDPNWVAAQMMYIDALLHEGRHHEAAHLAVNLLKRSKRPKLHLHLQLLRAWLSTNLSEDDLGLRHRPSGNPVTRMEYLEHLHEQFPDHPEVNELLVHGLLMEGDYEAAAMHLEAVLEQDTGTASLYLTLASLSEQAQLGYEEQLAKRAQERDGLTLEVAKVRAKTLHRSGHTESGLALLKQAGDDAIETAERAGKDSRSLRRQVKRTQLEYRIWTDDPRAEQSVRSYLHDDSNPESAAFVLRFPVTWEHPDLLDKAITILEESVGKLSPQATTARAAYILRYRSNDDAAMANAMMMMNDVLQRTPDAVNALSLMAALYLAGDSPQYDIAVRYLQRAVDAHPTRGELYPQLITLLQRQGDYAQARRYLDQMGRISGLNQELLKAQIELYESQGDLDAVIVRLSGQPDQKHTEQQDLLLFSALHRTGRHTEAEHVLRRLLGQPQPGSAVFAAAVDYYGNVGRIHEAQHLIETRLFDRNPGNAALLLGRLHQKHGERVEAQRWLRLAIEQQPDNAEAWNQLARLHLEQEEYDKAKDVVTEGMRAAPYHSGLRNLLAVITLNLSGAARDDAVALLEKHDHDCEALAATLEIYDRITSRSHPSTPTSRDLRDLRQLIRDHPAYLQGWRLAITAHAEAGDLKWAHELAREAIGRFPNHSTPAQLATSILISKGQLEAALDMAWIWRSRSLELPLEADAVIAAIYLDLKQPSAAASQLQPHIQRILAHHDRHPEHVSLMLRSLIQSAQVDEAARLFGPIIHKDERWFEAWIEATRTAPPSLAAHSLRRLEDALDRSPGEPHSDAHLAVAQEWIRLGLNNRDDGFVEEGRRRAAAMLNQNHNGASARSARFILASLAAEQGNFDAADKHYRAILDAHARDWEALRGLAELTLDRNESAERAYVWSHRAHKLQPDDLNVVKTHTRILLKLDRVDEAVDLLEDQAARLLRNRHHAPEGVQLWVRTLSLAGQWGRAQREIAPLLEEDDRWAQFLLDSSREWPVPAAASAIERAAEILTRTASGTLMVAAEWAMLGDRTGEAAHMINAMHLADRAEASSSALSFQATLLRASIAERIGNVDAAMEHYRSALRVDPDNAFALNNLAALLLRTGGNAADALELSQRALKQSETYPELLNTHARALLHANRYDEAEEYVRRALKRDAQRAEFLLTLSEIMLSKGEHDEARKWFLEAETAKKDHDQYNSLLQDAFTDMRRRVINGQ